MTGVTVFRVLRHAGVLLLTCGLSSGASALEVRILGGDDKPLPGAVISASETPHGPPPLPETAVIDQREKRFEPYVTVVAPGAAIEFPNSDDTRHHVYSFSPGNSFELKLYRTGEAPPVVFETPGTVTLGCNIHDNMKAYVVVADDPAIALSDAAGLAALAWLPAGDAVTLSVWHPQQEVPVKFELSAAETADGSVTLQLPVVWSDPQAVKSTEQLESLLKRFSRDAD